MASLEVLVRPNQIKSISPPKRSAGLSCDNAQENVILQFGKGGQGRIFTISFSQQLRRYMTKQQREICNDGDQ